MNKKQKRILEDNFKIYKDNNLWDLENWTNGGVDMFISIDSTKNIIYEFQSYLNNFDIDEEIEIHRQDERYRKAFKITESVKDFEDWKQFIEEITRKLVVVQDEDN